MARRRKHRSLSRILLSLAALIVLGAGVWHSTGENSLPSTWRQWFAHAPPHGDVVDVSAARVDPANEGRHIRIHGQLHALEPVRDSELGVQANALVLLRTVQMRQWQEECDAKGCRHALGWSERPIDSSRFRVREGHLNPARFPFASRRFAADQLRLGAFRVDADAAADATTAVPFAITAGQLPPNLAASLRIEDGVLTSADPAHPAVGDLRVSYAIIAVGPRTLTGAQRGDRLVMQP